MKRIFVMAALIIVSTFATAQTKWTIDASHSQIGFNVTHLVISEVEGKFNEFSAEVSSPSDDFAGSTVDFTAEVNSIDTDNEQRDGHLKSPDFFDAANHPKLTFTGKIVKKGSDYMLEGDLTIRSTTKKVSFDVDYNGTVTDPWGNVKSGFKVAGVIKRKEYGLQWDALTEAGGAVVSNEVEIVCKIELQKQK